MNDFGAQARMMDTGVMETRVRDIRASLNGEHEDPRALFDDVQSLIIELQQHHLEVPADLRDFVAELEAEIVEDFYDNLPV